MSNYTRKQYNADLKANAEKMAGVQSELARLNTSFNAGNLVITDEVRDKWNDLHDEEYRLEREQREIEHKWATRKWGHQDWVRWDLVTSNVD